MMSNEISQDRERSERIKRSLQRTAEELPEKKGFLNPYMVKTVMFVIVNFCIFFGVVMAIMSIWDFAQRGVMLRTLTTLAVIALGCKLFSSANEQFG